MKVDWNEMTLQEKKAGMSRVSFSGSPMAYFASGKYT